MLVGIISDTHGLLRPEAVDVLQGSELVIHAGDIGSANVVERLLEIAPVVAIRGNVDTGEWAARFPEDEVIRVQDKLFYVLHNLNEIDLDPVAAGFDVVISGHSHKPLINKKDGVLYVNPGSAGPRRFKLPVAVAMLRVTSEDIQAHIQELIV